MKATYDENNSDTYVTQNIIELIREAFSKLLDKMTRCTLASFGITKRDDLRIPATDNPNRTLAAMLLNVFEVLTEYKYMSFKRTEDNCQEVLQLFVKSQDVAKFAIQAIHAVVSNNKAKKIPAKKKAKLDPTHPEDSDDDDSRGTFDETVPVLASQFATQGDPMSNNTKGAPKFQLDIIHSLDFLAQILDDLLTG